MSRVLCRSAGLVEREVVLPVGDGVGVGGALAVAGDGPLVVVGAAVGVGDVVQAVAVGQPAVAVLALSDALAVVGHQFVAVHVEDLLRVGDVVAGGQDDLGVAASGVQALVALGDRVGDGA